MQSQTQHISKQNSNITAGIFNVCSVLETSQMLNCLILSVAGATKKNVSQTSSNLQPTA
jgi:hypothetical protein